MRKTISKAQRFRVLARDGFKCRYCGAKAPDVQLHLDHFIAVADGGGSGDENLVTCCSDCIFGKSDRKLTGIAMPIGKLTSRRGRRVKAGDPRNRGLGSVRKDDPNRHVLNPGAVIETGEEKGEVQAVKCWCTSHQRYEWHDVPRYTVGSSSGYIERYAPDMTLGRYSGVPK
jgi:hypothetical protein